MKFREALRRTLQIKLDHFGRARANKDQHFDIGAAVQQTIHHPVKLVVNIGKAREIALIDDRGGKARLGKNHHTGGRLDEMRAGARANNQEKRVLYFAMQPDNTRQPAKHLALATLFKDRLIDTSFAGRLSARHAEGQIHCTTSIALKASASICSRAARSLKRNWAAFTT